MGEWGNLSLVVVNLSLTFFALLPNKAELMGVLWKEFIFLMNLFNSELEGWEAIVVDVVDMEEWQFLISCSEWAEA